MEGSVDEVDGQTSRCNITAFTDASVAPNLQQREKNLTPEVVNAHEMSEKKVINLGDRNVFEDIARDASSPVNEKSTFEGDKSDKQLGRNIFDELMKDSDVILNTAKSAKSADDPVDNEEQNSTVVQGKENESGKEKSEKELDGKELDELTAHENNDACDKNINQPSLMHTDVNVSEVQGDGLIHQDTDNLQEKKDVAKELQTSKETDEVVTSKEEDKILLNNESTLNNTEPKIILGTENETTKLNTPADPTESKTSTISNDNESRTSQDILLEDQSKISKDQCKSSSIISLKDELKTSTEILPETKCTNSVGVSPDKEFQTTDFPKADECQASGLPPGEKGKHSDEIPQEDESDLNIVKQEGCNFSAEISPTDERETSSGFKDSLYKTEMSQNVEHRLITQTVEIISTSTGNKKLDQFNKNETNQEEATKPVESTQNSNSAATGDENTSKNKIGSDEIDDSKVKDQEPPEESTTNAVEKGKEVSENQNVQGNKSLEYIDDDESKDLVIDMPEENHEEVNEECFVESTDSCRKNDVVAPSTGKVVEIDNNQYDASHKKTLEEVENSEKGIINVVNHITRNEESAIDIAVETNSENQETKQNKEEKGVEEIECLLQEFVNSSNQANKNRTGSSSEHEKLPQDEKEKKNTDSVMDIGTVDSSDPKKTFISAEASLLTVGLMRCKHCLFTTDQKALLDAHACKKINKHEEITLMYSQTGKYNCRNCSIEVHSKKKFEEHIASHLLADPYICVKCKITFESKKDIEKHVRQMHSNEVVKCGLKGSKKINKILEMLHSKKEIKFNGRSIDPKLLMNMVEQKEKINPSQSNSTKNHTNIDSKPVQKGASKTILSVPNVKASTITPIQKPSVSMPTQTSAPKTIVNIPAPILSVQGTSPVMPTNTPITIIGDVANKSSPMILVPISVQNTAQPSPRIMSTPFTLQTSQGQIGSRIIPVNQPQTGRFVNISPAPASPVIVNGSSVIPSNKTNLISTKPGHFVFVSHSKTVVTNALPVQSMVITTMVPNVVPKQNTMVVTSGSLPTTITTLDMQECAGSLPTTLATVDMQEYAGPSHPNKHLESYTKPKELQPVTLNKSQHASIVKDNSMIQNSSSKKQNIDFQNKCSKTGKKQLLFKKSGSDYSCDYCDMNTKEEEIFKEHVWNHVHKFHSMCKLQSHSDFKSDLQCPVVQKIMEGLKRAAAAAEAQRKSQSQGKLLEADQVVLISDDEEEEKLSSRTITKDSQRDSKVETDESSFNNDHDEELQIKITSTFSLSEQQSDDDKSNRRIERQEFNEVEERPKTVSEAVEIASENLNEEEKGEGNDLNGKEEILLRDSLAHSQNSEKEKKKDGLAKGDVHKINTNDQHHQNKTDVNKAIESVVSNRSSTAIEENKHGYQSSTKFYQCGFEDCLYAASTSTAYREHVSNMHAGSQEYHCAHCGHKSYTEECHFRHISCHAKLQSGFLFRCCDGCKFGVNILSQFREHLEKIHPSLPSYLCSSCQEIFGSIDDLIRHCESNKLQFVLCPYCTMRDVNRRVILKHILEVHPGKPRQITVTSQLICQERELNSYSARKASSPAPSSASLIETDKIKKEQTEMPEENSDSLESILQEEHQSENQGSKQVNDSAEVQTTAKSESSLPGSVLLCPKCSYLAISKAMLKKHDSLHQKPADRGRPFHCTICPTTCDQRHKFEKHMHLHIGNHKAKIYMCAHCQYQTNLKDKIIAHTLNKHHGCVAEIDYTIHTLYVNVEIHTCEVCKYITRDVNDFNNHIAKHNCDAKINQNGEEFKEKNMEKGGKRFTCHICKRSFHKLPQLKQHLGIHAAARNSSILLYKCAYCSFMSTAKSWITDHMSEKHHGKEIKWKKILEQITSSNDAPHNEESSNESVSIDKYHCDCCSFSCDSLDSLIQHTKIHLVVTTPHENESKLPVKVKEEYKGPKKPYYVPSGNVFKEHVSCSECSFKTKTRLDLLRHIKGHPNLEPKMEISPKKEAKPQEKATKELVKFQFGKRKASTDLCNGSKRRRKTDDSETSESSSDIDVEEDWSAEEISLKKRKQVAVKSTTGVKSKQLRPASLYFLGGDLLHMKLKPCYIKDINEPMFECVLCKDVFEDKYSLHKHILEHMNIAFYKCNYCENGELEISAMVVHIQKIHRKPITHTKIELNVIEDRINKAIHEMKAKEYWGESEFTNENISAVQDVKPTQEILQKAVEEDPKPETENINVPQPVLEQREDELVTKVADEKPPKQIEKSKLPECIIQTGNFFKCILCNHQGLQSYILIRHAMTHCSRKRILCPYCSHRSHYRSDVCKHIHNKHPQKKVKVTFDKADVDVDAQYITPNMMKQILEAPEPKFHIDASSTSPSKNEGTVKAEPVSSEKGNETNECENSANMGKTSNDRKLVRHVVGYWSVYKCILCKTTFKSKTKVFQHIRETKCKRPLWKCSSCKKFKSDKEKLVKDHVKGVHPLHGDAKPILCSLQEKIRKHTMPKSVFKWESGDVVKTKEKKKAEENLKEEAKPAPFLIKNGEEWSCTECDYQSDSRSDAISHTFIHTKASGEIQEEKNLKPVHPVVRKGDLWKCTKCHYQSNSRGNAIRHTFTHANFKKYGCPVCAFRAKVSRNVKSHMQNCHPEEKFRFRIYTEPNHHPDIKYEPSDSSSSKMSTDYSYIKESIAYQCAECGFKSERKSSLSKHINAKCLSQMRGCSECDFSSIQEKDIKEHIENIHEKAHIVELPLSAKIKEIQSSEFKSKGKMTSLVNDEMLQKGKFKLKLKPVIKSPVSKPLSSEMKIWNEKNESQNITCPECKSIFNDLRNFRDHFVNAHKTTKILCGECEQYAAHLPSLLFRHARLFHNHTKFSNVKMKVISKENLRDKGLHERIVIQYKCPKCGHIAERGPLKKHLYIHYNYNPYQCNFCDMKCKAPKNIRVHISNIHPDKRVTDYTFCSDPKLEKEIRDLIEANRHKTLTKKTKKILSSEKEKSSSTSVEALKKEEKYEDIEEDFEETDEEEEDDGEPRGDLDHMFSPCHNYKVEYDSKKEKTIYKCSICPYTSTVNKTIVTHFYHHVPHIFKCPYCDFQCYPRSKISNHVVKMHPGKAVHVVDLRQKMGNFKFRNYENKNAKTKIKEKRQEREMMSKNKLDRSEHVKRKLSLTSSKEENEENSREDDAAKETGRIVYNCFHCDKRMNSLYHYRQHLGTHDGFRFLVPGTQIESKLKCGYCSYLAPSDVDFQNHMEYHFATRPFSCPYCTFSQYRASGVTNHIKKAHPGKPVDVIKQSDSSCLIGEQDNDGRAMLVDIDPIIRLSDIFAMDSEEFEGLLTNAGVCVIDLNYIPDEKFDVVSKTLGLGENTDKDEEDMPPRKRFKTEKNNQEIDGDMSTNNQKDTKESDLEDLLERGEIKIEKNPNYEDVSDDEMGEKLSPSYEDISDNEDFPSE